jgi:CRP-like cAMP-binding protein
MNISLDDKVRVVQKDEILFKEGQNPTHLIIVKSGGILCLKRSKERLVPVMWGSNQKIIGEEAVLTGLEHGYSAIVMAESEIVEIDAQEIKRTMASAPAWMSGLLVTLGERANDTASAIAEHRISHNELSGGQELAPEEETRLKKLLS